MALATSKPMSEKAPSSSDNDRQAKLRGIERALAKKQLLLQIIREIQASYAKKSDLGWFLSMATLEAGTILAVLSGGKARKWADTAKNLETEILLLEIERRLQLREIELAG